MDELEFMINHMNVNSKHYASNISSSHPIDKTSLEIVSTNEFNTRYVEYIMSDPSHHKYINILAYRIGQINDIPSFKQLERYADNIVYPQAKNIFKYVAVGASKTGHIDMIVKTQKYGIDINNQHLIFNICQLNNNSVVKKLLDAGCTNYDACLFGVGAAGNMSLLPYFFRMAKDNILYGLFAACQYGKIDIIEYYYFDRMGRVCCQYYLLSIALKAKQYGVVDLLIRKGGIDVQEIMFRKIPDSLFDYGYYEQFKKYLIHRDKS